jgi:hypothetical protein
VSINGNYYYPKKDAKDKSNRFQRLKPFGSPRNRHQPALLRLPYTCFDLNFNWECSLIVYFNPAYVVFLAYLLQKESMTKSDILAFILVLGGCYIVLTVNKEADKESSNAILRYFLADLASLCQRTSIFH